MKARVSDRFDAPTGGGAAVEGGESGRSLVTRIASIMDAFNDGMPVLGLAELSRRSGLPKSTVHRLAEQLREMGWLERIHNGYRVGMRIFELGGLAAQLTMLRDPAIPHLHQLASRTGLSVQLAVPDGGEIVYLDRVATGGVRLAVRQGARMPAYCTALGKAMLAFDEATAEAVLASPLDRWARGTLADAARLGEELRRTNERGVAFDREEAYEGLGCVAAPIRGAGRAIGAVSVAGPIDQLDWHGLSSLVQSAAQAIWNERFSPQRERVAS